MDEATNATGYAPVDQDGAPGDGTTPDGAAAGGATASDGAARDTRPPPLAPTPPMGFNNWNSTQCGPEFTDAMIRGVADLFLTLGLKDAGYEYVNIDDCWALPQRDADGDLVPDPARFPEGIKPLVDYVHSKGLKFGIYTSAGTRTCSERGFPGALGHEVRDAALFASWGVDYLKYDNCHNQGIDARLRYRAMRDAIAATGRPMVLSVCEWGENRPWEWAFEVGQLWRTTPDIRDSWDSMLEIAKANMALAEHAGPNRWNDPDMLEVGNGGLTWEECRTHFSLWAMMAAPLLIGVDLRSVAPEAVEILTNAEVIALDQDPLGEQARVVRSEGGLHVLVKRLHDGGRAVALFNENDVPARIATSAAEAGLPRSTGYRLRDVWARTDAHSAGDITAWVPPHGVVVHRVTPEPAWLLLPPAVDAGLEPVLSRPGALPLVDPDAPSVVTTSLGNNGWLPVLGARVDLEVPPGWRVRPRGQRARSVLAGGDRLDTTWEVLPPAGLEPGRYRLTALFAYLYGWGRRVSADLEVVVPHRLPSGTSYLSDAPWLRASNGFGPVEVDTSNGEAEAGDGGPLTVNGRVFEKGLGVHAPSSVEYFTGGRCTSVSAFVGVDDEKPAAGSVVFQVWADDRKVADSGVLTTRDDAVELVADVTGAQTVRLVVTDAGNGVDSDHGDWGDLKATCE
ncbi:MULTISPECIES: NPCBM/NEW2 domain-containing protein [Actinosynnema]|uniref:NPCBM/NEW2 domain-containing protein n=1 Tax=Actinosynnema TaxID=40566 RepID=UPI0020A349F3|nr:NPCBM/NEW2 domain-containing protein [Actinosynnema pretiosum]MCP2092842.1 alpha-galactosidase [Actinosynnema pretiosum]